jgi:cytochrome c556
VAKPIQTAPTLPCVWHHAVMKRAIVVVLLLAAVALAIVVARNRPSLDQQAADFRQALMTVIDGVSAPLFGMQRGEQPYDEALVRKHAEELATLSGMVSEAFERDTRGAHLQTAALPYVWSDRAAFAAALARMQQAATGLQRAAAGADRAQVGRATQALDNSCVQCHRQFRAEG